MKKRLFSCFISFVTCLSWAAAQSTADVAWETLTSSNGEFAVAAPAGYIVHKEKRWNQVSVVGNAGGASYRAYFHKTSDALDIMKRMHEEPKPDDAQHADYTDGSTRLCVRSYESGGVHRKSVVVASKNGYYFASLAARTADNSAMEAVLASLQLKGTPIVKDPKVPPPVTIRLTNVKSLESSPIVMATLHRRQTEPIIVETDEDPGKDAKTDETDRVYSRPLLVVEKPIARYTDTARANSVSGTVRLRVLFKGNGNIGRITVVKGLGAGMTEQAIEAAKKIKFLPAEVDGNPADVVSIVEYGFRIGV